MTNPSPSFVEELLERCILALEVGDRAAVDALLRDHPDAAPVLRERLDQLTALGILQAPTPPPIPERLGEFRLLRQIGRGGMGIVFLAEQTPLQRQVALKLVHPEQRFFPGARERFRREVLAVARLQHPGIVPVLTCGEADGIPYYAMELVAGASLAEILGELAGTAPAALDGKALRTALQRAMAKKHDHTAIADAPVFQGAWPNVCCRIALFAAEALQHAHEHGVLHRDVKPSNLLLCATGRVRLIDFGLASAQGEQRITRSGSAFGSLPYMAPEQVRGDLEAISARTDVYALGVTLYELLTLTLPHGDGSGTTRERILAGLIEPPAQRNAQIHPDVEAVCLLAMDLDRDRRYPTASAFAEDLRAFLDNRSVRARRPSWWLRTRRWTRRHPARTAALAVLFLALGPGPLVFAVQQSVAATRIQSALDAAERNLEQALAAVDQMLFRTAASRLVEHPRTARLRKSLLEDAIAFYERLLDSTGTASSNLRVRAERARTQVRVGRLYMEFGDLPKAAAVIEEAIGVLTTALPAWPSPERVRIELATAHHYLSEVYGRLDRVVDQERAERQALDLYQQVVAAEPGNAVAATSILDSRLSLASTLGRLRQFALAQEQLDAIEAVVLQAPSPPLNPAQAAQWRLAAVHAADHRGVVLTQAGETELARQAFATALARLEALPPEEQHGEEVSAARLGIFERLGQIGLQRREWELAAPWFEKATAELELRVRDEPDLVGPRARLAEILGSRATNRRELKDAAGARDDHDRAIALLEQVAEDAPTEVHHGRRLAIALAERAGWHFGNGDLPAARRDLEAAESRFAEVVRRQPADAVAKANYAAVLANFARTLASQRQTPAARAKADQALALARDGSGGENERALVELCSLAADLAMQENDTDAGQEFMDEASERAAAWLQKRPEDPLRLSTTAMIGSNRGTMYLQMGQHERAIEVWQAALPTARAVAKSGPFGRQVLAILLLRLADVSMRDGDVPKAREWFAAAITETQVQQAQMKSYPPLARLFDAEALRDLVPPTNEAGK